MSDPRLVPANTRVAADRLKGQVKAETYTKGTPYRVTIPVADLLRNPHGARDRQVLYGERVIVYETHEDHAYVEATKDGYVGYIKHSALTPSSPDDVALHCVSARSTHLYSEANLKSPEGMALSFGSPLLVTGQDGGFCKTDTGVFVPKQHVRPIEAYFDDPVSVAELFLGTPYLWGGNSAWGIDCSGLVQAAFLACDIPCPGDSDLQEQAMGAPLPVGTNFQRGDLLFWKGHVALAIDDKALIHANGYSMSVTYENIRSAIERIESQGEGPLTSHRRISE